MKTLEDNEKQRVWWIAAPHPRVEKYPTNWDKLSKGIGEITKQFLSGEGRIKSTEKLAELHVLRYHLFRTRQVSFQRMEVKNNAIEMRCKKCNGFQDELLMNEANAINMEEECVEVVSTSPWSTYNYEVNMFVAEQAENTSEAVFWIAKKISVVRDRKNMVASTKMDWYEVGNNGKCLKVVIIRRTFHVIPSSGSGKRIRGRLGAKHSKPFINLIETSSVVVYFSCLAKKRKLPMDVRRKLGKWLSPPRVKCDRMELVGSLLSTKRWLIGYQKVVI